MHSHQQLGFDAVDSPNQICSHSSGPPPSPPFSFKKKDPIRQRIRQGSRDEASAAGGGRREDGTKEEVAGGAAQQRGGGENA